MQVLAGDLIASPGRAMLHARQLIVWLPAGSLGHICDVRYDALPAAGAEH
ncbi:MAG: hypothetical protein ACREDD_12350 [Methylocella sp.]